MVTRMKLTETQFQALEDWIKHEAYKAAGDAVHQSRSRDKSIRDSAHFWLVEQPSDAEENKES